jgi:hypothetical protein
VNDLIIRATALALRAVPEANAQWHAPSGQVKLVSLLTPFNDDVTI